MCVLLVWTIGTLSNDPSTGARYSSIWLSTLGGGAAFFHILDGYEVSRLRYSPRSPWAPAERSATGLPTGRSFPPTGTERPVCTALGHRTVVNPGRHGREGRKREDNRGIVRVWEPST
jgi:hypothetical protein